MYKQMLQGKHKHSMKIEDRQKRPHNFQFALFLENYKSTECNPTLRHLAADPALDSGQMNS
jgi:hypothetical protein